MAKIVSTDKILYLLKTRGSLTAKDLADALSMTSMGARQHLLALEVDSLVESIDRAEKVGRPTKYWRLTDSGHSRFPDRYGDLTLTLVKDVKSIFGEQGLERLLDKREKESFSNYSKSLSELDSTQEKVRVLAALRSEEGYMAEAIVDDDSGYYHLVENHCPISVVAKECQQFCQSELDLFKRLFGDRVSVSREEHIISGERRCAYLFKEIE